MSRLPDSDHILVSSNLIPSPEDKPVRGVTGRCPGMWGYEREAWRAGYRLVAGVDEAGRGPLAGPVIAAAVILPSDFDPNGINDSKKLTASERETAFDRIMGQCHCVGIGSTTSQTIDQVNILQATRLAMLQALENLDLPPDFVLLDGLKMPGFPFPSKAIVKGDSASVSIAAASIVAKVTRDRIMEELDSQYPQYGFARHKGYGAPEHLEALKRFGPCPEHRFTFSPIRKEPERPCLAFDEQKDS